MTFPSQTPKVSALRRSRPCPLSGTMQLSLMQTTLLMALVFDSASAFLNIARSTSNQASVYTALPLTAVRDASSEQQNHDSRWWNPLVSSSTTETQDDSASVDDYLRFLEHRYTRLYEDEPEATKSFNVLDWLKQGEAEHVQLQQNHDAFYALGVAGLAGKELLQSHGDQTAPTDANLELARRTKIIDSPSIRSSPTSSQVFYPKGAVKRQVRSSTLVAAVTVLMTRVLAQRRVLLQLQTRRMHSFLVMVIKTTKAAPKTLATQLWHMGGGKQNVFAAVSVIAAVAFLALRLVAHEGLGA
jgi:hypothetical protein